MNFKGLFIFITSILFTSLAHSQSIKLDSSFNNTGKILYEEFPYGMPTQPILYPNGDLIFYGTIENSNAITVQKIDKYGVYIDDFGINGKVNIHDNLTETYVGAMSLQSNNKILISGSYYNEMDEECLFITRLLPNGDKDISFGDGGTRAIEKLDTSLEITSLAVLPDNDIILGGILEKNGSFTAVLFKLDSEGNIDPSFDHDGMLVPHFAEFDAISSIKIADDKFVVSGSAGEFYPDFLVARFNFDGTVDKSFNGTGFNIINFAQESASEAFNFAIDSKNRIVLTGYYIDSDFTDIATVRINSNGLLDESFGNEGKLISKIGHGGGYARNVKALDDNSIIIFGQSAPNEAIYKLTLIHIDENGKLVSDFGEEGLFFIDMPYEYQEPIFIERNGNEIYLGGIGDNNDNEPGATFIAKLLLTETAANKILNAPNFGANLYPSVAKTSIEFSYFLSKPCPCKLQIFDMNGNYCQNVLDLKNVDPGIYNKDINISNLNAGIYFVKMVKSFGSRSFKFTKI